jgi:hypothetical protein
MSDGEPHWELIVLLHAWTLSPASLDQVMGEVRRLKPDAEILVPSLPLGVFSMADPAQMLDELLSRVDSHTAVRDSGRSPSLSITLIGHSFGAVLARALFVAATGGLGYRHARRWARSVDRIILLAGTNRGWTPSSATSWLQRIQYALVAGVGHLFSYIRWRDPVIFHIRRGAPFLTCLRLEWLRLQERWAEGNQPIIVQLLGTVDDFVSPSDNLDLATGRDFFYLEVPGSGHVDVVDIDSDRAPEKTRAIVEARRDKFEQAFTATRDVLTEIAIRPADVDDLLQLATDDFDVDPVAKQFPGVRDVVFVIHGIRDKGFWTKKVARRIKETARIAERRLQSVTSTYGYFAMAPFMLPWTRRAKVEWLMDQYVEAKSLYPNARFSYLGHSNGTYLLARALQMCPLLAFEHVVFAGSVVRRDYDWRRMVEEGRVRKVLNFVASADWVVAIFPKALQTLHLQDLGSAGHDGFVNEPKLHVRDVEYVPGRHHAALHEHYWDTIAQFVVHGTLPDPRGPARRQSRWVKFFGWIGPAIWLVLIGIVVFIFWALLAPLGLLPVPAAVKTSSAWEFWQSTPPWFLAILLAGYLSILRRVLTSL